MLLGLGAAQAEEEDVLIGLESSELARLLYVQQGFRECGCMHIRDFPIEGVPMFLWALRGVGGRCCVGTVIYIYEL